MLGKGTRMTRRVVKGEDCGGQYSLSFRDQPWVSHPLKHPGSCLHADTHSLSHSPSGVWLSMPLSVWLRMSLTSSLVPPNPPSLLHTHTEPSLFPICHPLLSRQQCRLSKVLVIDCYCKVGWALRYWISSDCIKLWGWCGQWQLFGYRAPFVAASWLKDLIMDS